MGALEVAATAVWTDSGVEAIGCRWWRSQRTPFLCGALGGVVGGVMPCWTLSWVEAQPLKQQLCSSLPVNHTALRGGTHGRMSPAWVTGPASASASVDWRSPPHTAALLH